jgi:hypothetical protein
MTELDVMHTLGACPSTIIISRRDVARACVGLRDDDDVLFTEYSELSGYSNERGECQCRGMAET